MDGDLQKPNCWSELPEHIWLRVLQNLSTKDVHNLHLVCYNLHRIVSGLHLYPNLGFNESLSGRFLGNPTAPLRLFKEFHFDKESDFLQQNFEKVQELIKHAGAHVQKLTIKSSNVDPGNLLKLLTWCPNLKSLILEDVRMDGEMENIEWKLQLFKLESIKMRNCTPKIESILTSLSESKIKELDLAISITNTDKQMFLNFLKSQEDNLKSLTILCVNHDLLNGNGLKLKLEHLAIDMAVAVQPSGSLGSSQEFEKFVLGTTELF